MPNDPTSPAVTDALTDDAADPSSTRPDSAFPYFEVGLVKFIAMSIVTFGMYELYWAYQEWKRIKMRTSDDLSPFWRAAFGGLWGFSLFARIRKDALSRSVPVHWWAGFLGTFYLLMGVLWELPDPWWLISLLTFVPLVPVVLTIRLVHDRLPGERDRNTRFTALNVVALVLGGIWVVLAVIGTFAHLQ